VSFSRIRAAARQRPKLTFATYLPAALIVIIVLTCPLSKQGGLDGFEMGFGDVEAELVHAVP
jgi:hypothetical protein